ncbi:MAG: amino acid permease [Ignavibacteriae bacterium]|nr:amino acid permease [Ignavibacteriota bacterium]
MEDKHTFKRELGLFDSTMLVVGSMIGSGIFIVSADIARTVSSPGWLIIAWIVTGVITLAAALCYGELAAMMPHAGGQYVYLRESWNPLTGFLYGWTFYLVIQTGTIAAVAVAFAKYTGVLIPWFSEQHILLHLGSFKITAAQILAIISIAILTFINAKGVKLGKFVQNGFTFTKSFALILLIILGLTLGAGSAAMKINFSDFWSTSWVHVKDNAISSVEPLAGFGIIIALVVAMVGSLFSSDAWNNITFTAGEVKEPKRMIPLSLVFGTGIVTILYIAANFSYLFILPLKGNPQGLTAFERGIQFATSDRVATGAISVFLGDSAAVIMAVLIMISTFGCNNGLILAGARVTYAMAKDNLFFKKSGELNRHGVPGTALLFQAVWASVLCLSGTYSDLLDYVVFAVLVFYILTIAGIFKLRKTEPDAERPYKTLGYPILPALYILLAAIICIILLIYKPQYTWPGVGIVLLGIPVYFVWKKFSVKPEKQ